MTTSNKVAMVTGAGTGIGKASALALANAGFNIVVAGRRPEPLEETVKEAPFGVKAIAVPTDVSDPAQVEALFAKTKETFGRLDVLFNNAGMGSPRGLLEDIDFAAWQQVVGVNLTGVFLCTQAAFRIMKDQDPRGGHIINNGSISAHAPRPNSIGYTATKHAVTGITKSTSLDGRKYDIACGQIDIGNAVTRMVEARDPRGSLQPNGEMMVEATMDVKHVADAVVYMASLPLDVNVQFLTVMATKMPFVGRG